MRDTIIKLINKNLSLKEIANAVNMSEKELLKDNLIYDLIVKNNLKSYYDWNEM